jgi:hypothetical protein
MTLADLARIAETLERLRTKWEAAILPRVESKVADAHAHGRNAITDRLKSARDGRRTVQAASGNPSYNAAVNRLDELWTHLAGPSVTSLDGAIRDAREAFYREAFALHKPIFPRQFLVSEHPEPTQAGINLVRAAAIHNYDPRRELEGPITDAKRKLSAAVAAAGHSLARARDEAEALSTWKNQTLGALTRSVQTLLSDSVEYADGEARRDLTHPDYRAEQPLFPRK